MNTIIVNLVPMIIVGLAASGASEAAQINQKPIHRNSFLEKFEDI
jgi:hypothetical protein